MNFRKRAEANSRQDQEHCTGEDRPSYFIEIELHVKVRPGDLNQARHYEDRYNIYQVGNAEPVSRIRLPYESDRNDVKTLKTHGWRLVGELEYIADRNAFRGSVKKLKRSGRVRSALEFILEIMESLDDI